jgi:hypothetical protein
MDKLGNMVRCNGCRTFIQPEMITVHAMTQHPKTVHGLPDGSIVIVNHAGKVPARWLKRAALVGHTVREARAMGLPVT